MGWLVTPKESQNERASTRFGQFRGGGGWLGTKLAKTSTSALDLANFEVVGHRKAQIDQTENLRARFGQFEVVVGWLGQRNTKIDQNEHLRTRFSQFRGGGVG